MCAQPPSALTALTALTAHRPQHRPHPRSNVCPNPLRPHRRALTTLHPLTGRAWFGRSLPYCPHLAALAVLGSGFQVFQKYSEDPPPSALRPPPLPSALRRSLYVVTTITLTARTAHGLCHCSHRLYVVTTLPPPLTAFTPLPLSPPGRPWFGLCHCPHLAALGSGFHVEEEASNVCPPLRPHRPHRSHRPHTPTALISASPSHSESSPPSLTARTAHRLHSSTIVLTWPPKVGYTATPPADPTTHTALSAYTAPVTPLILTPIVPKPPPPAPPSTPCPPTLRRHHPPSPHRSTAFTPAQSWLHRHPPHRPHHQHRPQRFAYTA